MRQKALMGKNAQNITKNEALLKLKLQHFHLFAYILWFNLVFLGIFAFSRFIFSTRFLKRSGGPDAALIENLVRSNLRTYFISLENRRHPPSSSIETPFPCVYNCTVLWVVDSYTDRQLLQYTVQTTEQLYRHWKFVSIYDDGGGIYILCILIFNLIITI